MHSNSLMPLHVIKQVLADARAWMKSRLAKNILQCDMCLSVGITLLKIFYMRTFVGINWILLGPENNLWYFKMSIQASYYNGFYSRAMQFTSIKYYNLIKNVFVILSSVRNRQSVFHPCVYSCRIVFWRVKQSTLLHVHSDNSRTYMCDICTTLSPPIRQENNELLNVGNLQGESWTSGVTPSLK